ncbi:hypothetical protein B0H21DRAFT_419230 [Amylocystis lapponica]|nr:hypothetical protein B0H21DRAFT_419230 [Amylocystis lapponica]
MSLHRPVTSKSRGVCRYYDTPRGCFAGHQCKFLHGETEKHTPFDQNKVCKYYAAGYCRRGEQCWFLHTEVDQYGRPIKPAVPVEPEPDDVDNLCCICYEIPVTYGLLAGCSHIFCVKCIREWRDPTGKSEDVVASGVTKKCPLCRASSRFVTPSSRFYPEGHSQKIAIIERYKASMGRVPCRHFQKSPANDRFCPFGKDCFYQHVNEDGTPFKFEHGSDHYMKIYKRRLLNERFNNYHRSDSFGPLHWFNLDEFAVTVGALPELMDIRAGVDEDHRDDFEGEVDLPTAHRVQELVELLENLSIDEASEDGNTVYRFGTTSPILPQGPFEIREEDSQAMFDNTAMRLQSPPTVHTPVLGSPTPVIARHPFNRNDAEPIATILERQPGQGSVTSTLPASGSPPPATSHPRFSTVVRSRPRFFADLSNSDIVDTHTPIAPTTDSPNLRYFTWLGDDATPRVEGTSSEDTCALPDVENRPIEDDGSTSTSKDAPAFEAPHDHAQISPPSGIARDETTSAPPMLEALHDTDPPFLTDGRGRVVWSSTTALRHRDSRRGRPRALSASAQHKARRETPESVRGVEAAAQEDGRPRLSAAALPLAEGRPAGVGFGERGAESPGTGMLPVVPSGPSAQELDA